MLILMMMNNIMIVVFTKIMIIIRILRVQASNSSNKETLTTKVILNRLKIKFMKMNILILNIQQNLKIVKPNN